MMRPSAAHPSAPSSNQHTLRCHAIATHAAQWHSGALNPAKISPKHASTVAILLAEVRKRSPHIRPNEPCNFDLILEGNTCGTECDQILAHLCAHYQGVLHCCRSMEMRVVCLDDWQCVVSEQTVRLPRYRAVHSRTGVYAAHSVCKMVKSISFHALGAASGRSLRSCV